MSLLIQHRNRIVWIGLFLALVWIGDRIGASLFDRAVMSTGFRYAELYQGKLPAELVVLGNSRGLHMFHPPAIRDVAKCETANISFNGLPTVLMPILWRDYLSHQPPPERLIFEVSCVGRMDEPGSFERFKLFMGHSERLRQAFAERAPRDYAASHISHLYRFNSELTWRSMFFLGKSDRDWIMTDRVTEDQIVRAVERNRRHNDLDALIRDRQNAFAAREVLGVASANGIHVDLIVAPYHPRYRETLTDLPDWIEWLRGELGYPIHDYSHAISETSGFADHLHLNPDGARLLAEILDRDGIL